MIRIRFYNPFPYLWEFFYRHKRIGKLHMVRILVIKISWAKGWRKKMKSNGTLLDWPVKTRDMVMSHVLSGAPKRHSINGVWLKGFCWGALSAFWIWCLFACKAPW